MATAETTRPCGGATLANKTGRMPKIIVGRYSARGGTKSAPPVGREWLGWLEPEDKSWILWIRADEAPVFYAQREADGAVVEPPVSMTINGQFVAAHAMGADVHVVFDGTVGSRFGYLVGNVEAVTFDAGGKVWYDVRVPAGAETADAPRGSTVLRWVDSCFVLPPPPLREEEPEYAWRVGALDVGIREQIDTNVPGKPWVAHEHYEVSDGTTGSRRVAFGVDERDARCRGEAVAAMYPWPAPIPHPDEAHFEWWVGGEGTRRVETVRGHYVYAREVSP